MAEVWAARVEGPGGFVKPLALKFIRESFAGDSELERLFVNEARLSARLQHANLVGVFDFDRLGHSEAGAPSRYFIAMERVEGHDLRRVMQAAWRQARPLPVAVALYVAGEVLKGLRYVHERRDEVGGQPLELVHRDVSPHNVLVGRDGDIKLSDFGIAKARSLTGGVHTQAGTVRGKLAYAAPEQLRAESIDHRADQFALGVILWELLAQRRLFDGASEREIVEKVLGGSIPALAPTISGAAPPDPVVERIVRRMLSLRAADRYPSTADVLNAVLTAPGYSPDARPLVDLMQTLFAPQPAPMPRTIPMDLADPAPVRAAAVQAPTVELERPLLGDATGSSYVSDRSSALRSYARPARSRVGRVVLAAAVLGSAGVGAGVGLRRLVARTAAGGASSRQASAAPPPAPSVIAGIAPADRPLAAEPPVEAERIKPTIAAKPAGAPATPAPRPEPRRDDVDHQAPVAAKPILSAPLRGLEMPDPEARPTPVPPAVFPTGSFAGPPAPAPAPMQPPAAPWRVETPEKQRKGNVPNAAPILE